MAFLAYPGDATVPQVAHPALQLRPPPLHRGHIERYALQLEVGVLSAGGAAIAAIAAAAFLVPAAATDAATCNREKNMFVVLTHYIMDHLSASLKRGLQENRIVYTKLCSEGKVHQKSIVFISGRIFPQADRKVLSRVYFKDSFTKDKTMGFSTVST
jgi:hypothetical protein